MKQHGLSLNEDKSVCVIMGDKQQKIDASNELKLAPLMCGSFETKEVQVEKWLGQMFSAQGLADSVAKTLTARTGKIKAACFEIAQIVNDWRSQAVGGMTTALVLWEACCLPSLLHGAGTWTEINTQTVKLLAILVSTTGSPGGTRFSKTILVVGYGYPGYGTKSMD